VGCTSQARTLPELWYPVAWILLVVRDPLRTALTGGYDTIAAKAHRDLALAGAHVRRYLLAFSAPKPCSPPSGAPSPCRGMSSASFPRRAAHPPPLDLLARPDPWSGFDPDMG